MRVNLIDTFSIRSTHEQFNATLLVMLSQTFKSVKYFAGKESKQDVFSILSNYQLKNIDYKPCYVVLGKGKMSLLMRHLCSLIQNTKFLLVSSRDDLIIYPFNNLFNIWIINFINHFLNRKILIFCHGELELLTKTAVKVGLLHTLLCFFCRTFFQGRFIQYNIKIYYVVMADKILSNLKPLVNKRCFSQMISLDHAYIFHPHIRVRENSKSLKIGTIGLLNRLKGADNLCLLADKLNSRVREDLSISAIGRIMYDAESLCSRKINMPSLVKKTSLSRTDFEMEVDKLDYIIFLYPRDTYKLIASGAVMDAIRLRIPIIAIRNDYFEYLFQKVGNFGVLVDNLEQMAKLINSICQRKEKFTNIDFDKIQAKVSPGVIKNSLLQKLKALQFI